MGPRCIFFTENHSPRCQVLQALGLTDLPRGERAVLRAQFCTRDRFVECPLFRLAERGLAVKQLRLRGYRGATRVGSGEAPTGRETPEGRNDAVC